jgi:redox-sensitive bicupin YhaK (pirin superfamily)
MLDIRRDKEIHAEEGGWFSARWHFSFDRYRDPDFVHFGPLRVFNDDRLVPGAIWPMHPHRDVEGITYVVEGTFRHADSLGNDGILLPGAVQRMTLGAGAEHSEQNGSETEPMRFIQLWILPDTPGLPPENEQRQFTREDRTDRLLRVLGPEGGDVVTVHQDASMHVGSLTPGVEAVHELGQGRGAYVYVLDGQGTLDGQPVGTGDAARVTDAGGVAIAATGGEPMEVLLVDVPMAFEPVGIWRGRLA